MTLGQLLAGIPLSAQPSSELLDQSVTGLEYDSRKIQPGNLFFAFPGKSADGRAFARQALDRGALLIVSESAPPQGMANRWLTVPHGRRALSLAARRFHGDPDAALQLTGVTGTNGKTTTVFAIDSMLRACGFVTGLVGTIEYRVASEVRAAVNTTPESVDLIRLLADLRSAGGTHCTMEVSSHALALGRVYGLQFHTVVFTNLTRDHLDFHSTMEAYFDAKASLFLGAGGPPPAMAVINGDDASAGNLRVVPPTRTLTYGLGPGVDLRAVDLSVDFGGTHFTVEHPGGAVRVESPLSGIINVYNLLAAFGVGLSYRLPAAGIAQGLASCRAIPGRFEKVDEGQPFLVVVDYAHTDDALRNTIATARALKPARVITLFGCGGDRDRAKRPLMGQAAGEGSDLVIVTSDNPRSEDPLTIINDAMVGVLRTNVRYIVEPDRGKAIQKAIAEAGAGDIVLLAGKGHETYQVLSDRTIAFDDRDVARRVLQGYGYRKEAS